MNFQLDCVEQSQTDLCYDADKLFDICTNNEIHLNFHAYLKQQGDKKHPKPKAGILDDIHTKQVHSKGSSNEWVQIHSQTGWTTKMSTQDRAKLLKELERRQIIQCDHKYFFGPSGGKAKCYRFHPRFHKKVVRFLEQHQPVFKKKKARKQKSDEVAGMDLVLLIAIKENLAKVTYDGKQLLALCHQLGGAAVALKILQRVCNAIDEHDLNRVTFKAGRIHVSPQQVPKTCRSAIVHSEGKAIKDVDIKSCHPTFLYQFYKRESRDEINEMARYVDCISNGFYDIVSASALQYGMKPHADPKQQFNTFLNDRGWSGVKSNNAMFNSMGRAFCDMLPILHQRMREFAHENRERIQSKNGKSSIGIGLMQKELEVLEPVYIELTNRGIWWLPFHDGFIVEDGAEELAVSLARESLLKNIGIGDVKVRDWGPC